MQVSLYLLMFAVRVKMVKHPMLPTKISPRKKGNLNAPGVLTAQHKELFNDGMTNPTTQQDHNIGKNINSPG